VVGHARVGGRSTVRLVLANVEQSELILDRFIEDVIAVGRSISR
jgi:hypothetical protein